MVVGQHAGVGAPLAGTPDDSIALQGFEAGAASTEQKRTGLMAVLEFQPTDNFRSMFDLYYSKFDQDEIRRTLMSGMDTWGGASYSDFSTTALNGDTIVTGGTVDGVHPVALTSLNKRHDEIKAFGWNSQLEFGGGWTAVADLELLEGGPRRAQCRAAGGCRRAGVIARSQRVHRGRTHHAHALGRFRRRQRGAAVGPGGMGT